MIDPSLPLLLVPLTYAASAALVATRPRTPVRRAWDIAVAASGGAWLLALAGAATLGATAIAATDPTLVGTGSFGITRWGTRADPVTVTMLVLVSGVAAIIARFSRRYLHGDPGQSRFLRWFLVTMTAASVVVITNHLLLLAVAWTSTTLALHQLLTFYPDRPQALIAAHKKFLLSRVADMAIAGAVVLLWSSYHTFEIDALVARASVGAIPIAAKAAGVLLALGISLRSAQLPFHGWLIQVMEAPTPVSALLHAGVVNIGGFVLIRLAHLIGRIEVAQDVLVAVGTTTAVLAALVIMTRVSIKVMLAWSTAAQMGFMLLECGLGAYSLALLHLVAHSLYKAHAFLASGATVEEHTRRAMVTGIVPPTLTRWSVGALAGVALVFGGGTMLGVQPSVDGGGWALPLVLALAVAPLFAQAGLPGRPSALLSLALAIGVTGSCALAHVVFRVLAPVALPAGRDSVLRVSIVVIGFFALYVLQALISARPQGRLARALYPSCFAGFYLDEIFTRLTFRLWPPSRAQRVTESSRGAVAPVLEMAA